MYRREKELLKHYNNNVNYSSIDPSKGLDRLKLDIQTHHRVLDLGCGDGRWCRAIKDRYQAIPYGVDFSSERISKARDLNRDTNYGIWYQSEDAYKFVREYDASKWGKFDYTLMVEFIEHLENPVELLNSLRFVTKKIAGTVPLNFPYVAHLQVFKSEEEFKEMFSMWDLETYVISRNIYFKSR